MNQEYRSKCIFILGLIVCATVAFVANAQILPEGKGKAEFEHICSGCHSVSIATGQRMTRLQWLAVVSDMVSRGAQGKPEDFDNILTYLSTAFGEGSPLATNVSPTQPSPPVTERNRMPLTEGEVSRARKLLNENACLSCHRFDGMGSYLGPDLTGVGERRSSEQIHTSLVSPNKEVLPENRSVLLVTPDGKAIAGRLLNQDGFTVQLIDSASQLKSFQKSSLREFTIVTANPMPSYANKMSVQDLTDLVHYLSSLNDKGQP